MSVIRHAVRRSPRTAVIPPKPPPTTTTCGTLASSAAGIRRWEPAQQAADAIDRHPPRPLRREQQEQQQRFRIGVPAGKDNWGANAHKISATGRVPRPSSRAQHSRSVHQGAVTNSPVKGTGHMAKPVPAAIAIARMTRVPSGSTSSPRASLAGVQPADGSHRPDRHAREPARSRKSRDSGPAPPISSQTRRTA